ncbi:DUF3007 family protein [Leptolyngbya sp. CCY15150]|uniref:DUF3007 family protein n=1 Tax=Leptolyngbya sp. CCY15150 TaxID=2767772 RepID=UPI00194DB5EF|nr:DUF3007 family protein [Leptolyngbya sp. CCY15150]
MRRIDVIGVGFGIFAAGGLIYLGLRGAGLEGANAGIWSQVVLLGGVGGWLVTYLFRAGTHTMTYNQQLRDYEDAVLQKRLDEMTPEELAALQAKLDQESESSEDAIADSE